MGYRIVDTTYPDSPWMNDIYPTLVEAEAEIEKLIEDDKNRERWQA